jgi:hypothetical protein
MENTVIKVLTKEHGAKVIAYWKSLGVNTKGMNGEVNEAEGGKYIYYGVINNSFNNYPKQIIDTYGVKIIKLPNPTSKLKKIIKTITITSIKDWDDVPIGSKFTCTIDDNKIEGKIQKENNGNDMYIYLCQNIKSGATPRDTLGYNYGYTIANGSRNDIRNNNVYDLTVYISDFSKSLKNIDTDIKIVNLLLFGKVRVRKGFVIINGKQVKNKVIKRLYNSLVD